MVESIEIKMYKSVNKATKVITTILIDYSEQGKQVDKEIFEYPL